jgi:peptidoglycan LD-endopeptidase LytH
MVYCLHSGKTMVPLVRFICLVIFMVLVGCSTGGPDLFRKKSLHDQYAKKLMDAGLDKTDLGDQWLTAAEMALQAPQKVTLPYQEMGYFAPDHPRAVGLNFTARRGEKLIISIKRNPQPGLTVFAELWQMDEDGSRSMLLSFDSTQGNNEYEVDASGDYLVRLQPELLQSGDYTISISVGPTLQFPVAGKNGRIGSTWGDERDAGARNHEGIDLFAPKRTPVIAATDGVITRVNENRLGGRVVWQRTKGRNLSLYYAHLDEQLVTQGQDVKAGDTIGLVGNTGNARTTPPHLHFGIYTFSGAIDPLPFINPVMKQPSANKKSIIEYKEELRLSSDLRISEAGSTQIIKSNTLIKGLAISNNHIRVMLPDSMLVSIPLNKVERLETIRKDKINHSGFIFDRPQLNAARKAKLAAGNAVSVLGFFREFIYVKTEAGTHGWMPASLL